MFFEAFQNPLCVSPSLTIIILFNTSSSSSITSLSSSSVYKVILFNTLLNELVEKKILVEKLEVLKQILKAQKILINVIYSSNIT